VPCSHLCRIHWRCNVSLLCDALVTSGFLVWYCSGMMHLNMWYIQEVQLKTRAMCTAMWITLHFLSMLDEVGFLGAWQQMLWMHHSLEAYCATRWWSWSVPPPVMKYLWNDSDGKTAVLEGRACSSAASSTTDCTCAGPGLNLGLRGGRLAADCLSHGMPQTRCSR
jgi:hypothetical protein